VSAEPNNGKAQEQELWDRISTTEGAERAEVLDELSHIAYNRDNYIECLQLVDTSIEIYFQHGGLDCYLKELIHLYHGKAHCYENLKRFAEAAETHEELAKMKCLEDDFESQAEELRAAGCPEKWIAKCQAGEWAAPKKPELQKFYVYPTV